MITTSTETKPTVEILSAGDSSDRCERCGAPVDLTMSVLVKGNRVVGCPDCTWGSAPIGST